MLKAQLTGHKAQQPSKDDKGLRSEAELIERLNHLDGAVREAAISALGQLEAAVQRKHVVAIVGLLKKSDTKAHVRQASLAALAVLDQSLLTDHLVIAVAMLADSAHQVTDPNPN